MARRFALSLSFALACGAPSAEETQRQHLADLADYNLHLSGTELHMNGNIEPGVTRVARSLFAQGGQVKSFHLKSAGGNVYEARGLAVLVQEHALNTRAKEMCSSACTLVLIAGVERSATPGSKIGFHQYHIESLTPFVRIDVEKEQKRDLALFRAQGVSEEFAARVYSVPHDQIWYPSLTELLEAGVLTEIE